MPAPILATDMHYVIMQWVFDHWNIVHYSHNYDDFQRMIEKYPREDGYVHMVEIGWVESHKIKEFFNALKPKEQKNVKS